MAQPAYLLEHLGAVVAKAGQDYSTDSILDLYPTANAIQLKSPLTSMVSVNGSAYFPVTSDELSYLDTGKIYKFTADCILVIATTRSII
jgi:hypothetical protein